MPKINLMRGYTWGGKDYGPGEADVPEDAAKDLQAREAEYQQYLSEGGEPHAPVTPGMLGGAPAIDPRLKKPLAAQVPGAPPRPPAGAPAPEPTQPEAPHGSLASDPPPTPPTPPDEGGKRKK